MNRKERRAQPQRPPRVAGRRSAYLTMVSRPGREPVPIAVPSDDQPAPQMLDDLLNDGGEVPVADMPAVGSLDFAPPMLSSRPQRAPTPAAWSCQVCGSHSWWSWDEWGARRYCNDPRCMGSGPIFDPSGGLTTG